jgi:hypothetical protein
VLFNLGSALDAARRNSIERWVHDYLMGPGRNEPFAVGLGLRQRFWDGPVLIATSRLRRKCGPEPDMPFRVPTESWERCVNQIIATFDSIESFPPLIVEYRSGALIVSDGNHRLGAFSAIGIPACWVIVWYPDEVEKAHRDAHLERAEPQQE